MGDLFPIDINDCNEDEDTICEDSDDCIDVSESNFSFDFFIQTLTSIIPSLSHGSSLYNLGASVWRTNGQWGLVSWRIYQTFDERDLSASKSLAFSSSLE